APRPIRFSKKAGRTGLLLLMLLPAMSGCLQAPKKQPTAEVKSLQAKPEVLGSVTPTALQAEVMRFADEYSMSVAQAADDFALKVGTFEARQVAARLKVGQATAAVVNAAGHNPAVNALDMVVLTTAARMVAQDHLVGEQFGNDALPIAQTALRLETNAWSLVDSVLKPEQKEELRTLIRDWREKNPKQHYVAAVRFREFAEIVSPASTKLITKPNSIFGLLFLDPMAGLDPTLRAVEEARYLAERALYYGQRMPILLSWQVEYLSLQLSDQPAMRQVLTNANQVSASLAVFSETAARLPQLITQEREAAIQQFFAGLATERSNFLASVAVEEGKMRGLLAETRGALLAGRDMATAADGAVRSLDSFIRYVSPPRTNVTAEPANTNQRPFDVLDYGTAAGQVAGMAREINLLLTSANQSTTQAAQLGQQAAASLEHALQRGFWLAVLLILILLAGATVSALCYKLLARRLTPHQSGGDS
ncbi:MAG TPA: hypothetical protein VJS65_10780, partial [Verrucomicrobiae bacterium]|nr:hypothetical protein [Verrucomicrobiae bacterium]